MEAGLVAEYAEVATGRALKWAKSGPIEASNSEVGIVAHEFVCSVYPPTY